MKKLSKKELEVRRKATRERTRLYRERKKAVINTVTHTVTQEDIDNLPPSLKFRLSAETRTRQVLKMPDNLRERQEGMVRYFRGW